MQDTVMEWLQPGGIGAALIYVGWALRGVKAEIKALRVSTELLNGRVKKVEESKVDKAVCELKNPVRV